MIFVIFRDFRDFDGILKDFSGFSCHFFGFLGISCDFDGNFSRFFKSFPGLLGSLGDF